MNNSFLQILKDAIPNDIVYITYKQRKNIFYSKFFIKANNKFYDNKRDCFQLISHADNKLETIKACDIIKFQCSDRTDDNAIKNNFRLSAEKIKADYEKLLPEADIINNFNDYFFNENINLPGEMGCAVLLHINQMKIFGITDLRGWINNDLSVIHQICNEYYNILVEHGEDVIDKLKIEKQHFTEIADVEGVEEIDIIIDMILDTIQDAVNTKQYDKVLSGDIKYSSIPQLIDDMRKQWPPILLPVPF